MRLILGLGNPALLMAHPSIEYLFQPNQKVSRFGNEILINSHSMRSAEFTKHKYKKDEIRIMMLGDSVINGGNLTDQSELATTILKNKLQQGMHKLVTVGNISAGSWGPCSLLAYIEKYGLFDADVIIVVFNSEDYEDIPTFQPLNPHTHPQTRPLLRLTEAVVHYLPQYFPSLLGDSSMKRVPLISEASIRRSLGCIRDLINAAKSNSISVVVMQYLDREEVLSSPKSGYY